MQRLRQFVVLALFGALLGAPAMVCLAGNAQLTDEEKACCKEMANSCRSTDMPSSHSCCQTTVNPQHPAMVKPASSVTYDRIALTFLPVTIADTPQQGATGALEIREWRHPPPGYDSSTIEILRI